MLYPTLNQPIVLLALFACGIVCGLVFDVCKILTTLAGNDKFSKHFFDFLATIFSFLLLFFVNLWCNYGQFRLYVFLVFLIREIPTPVPIVIIRNLSYVLDNASP